MMKETQEQFLTPEILHCKDWLKCRLCFREFIIYDKMQTSYQTNRSGVDKYGFMGLIISEDSAAHQNGGRRGVHK